MLKIKRLNDAIDYSDIWPILNPHHTLLVLAILVNGMHRDWTHATSDV